MAIGWIYELTPEGLKRDTGPEAASPLQARTGRKLDVAIVALPVVVAGLLAWQQVGGQGRPS
ncbi:MAG: hypothetical protein R3200_08085 [Xanthomonadales bacterium]|nr:hypothetical protein [Xanthomonadales bacterium]